jgi:hypothetical protein
MNSGIDFYTHCAMAEIRTFLASDDSNIFSLGSKYFNSYSKTKKKLYVFITYTRCDNTRGIIDVPTHPLVLRRDAIEQILVLLIARSAATNMPLTRIRLYATQPVTLDRYHIHKKYTIDLVSRSFCENMYTLLYGYHGLHIVHAQPYQDLYSCSVTDCENHRLPLHIMCYTHSQETGDDIGEYASFVPLHSYVDSVI